MDNQPISFKHNQNNNIERKDIYINTNTKV